MEQNYNSILNLGTYQNDFKQPIGVFTIEDEEEFKTIMQKFTDKEIKKVITHSGYFHADEVMGCYLVRFLKDFKNYVIIRTRNLEIIKYGDIVIDVGDTFDTEKLRYDHHQKSFVNTFSDNHKIRLSSAGLVYKYHGKEAIKNIIKSWGLSNEYLNEKENENIDYIHNRIYESLFKMIDANDNGYEKFESKDKLGNPITLNYKNDTGYCKRVGRLCYNFTKAKDFNFDASFKFALNLAEEEFIESLSYICYIYLPGYYIVKDAYVNRYSFHKSGQVLFMENEGPWKEHLLTIEEEELNKSNNKDEFKHILFTINKSSDKFMICTIPSKLGSFGFKKGIAKSLRGYDNDTKLIDINIEDVKFVHKSGFIGSTFSLKSAIEIVELSLNDKEE